MIAFAISPKNSPSSGKLPLSLNNKIVASVNGSPIYESQLDAAIDKLKDNEVQRSEVLEHLVEQKLLSQTAEDAAIDKKFAVQSQLQLARDTILSNAMVDQFIEENVTDEDLQVFYDAQAKLQKPELQIKARQIVSPDEATAKEVVRRLEDGKSFNSIALAFSIDRATRERGGDMGYISQDVLDPNLTEKIFAGKDGERLPPFQTDQGWHVVEILSRRKSPIASFEDRYEHIRKLVSAQKIEQLLNRLKKEAEIEYIKSNSDSDISSD